jgi:glycosyltransferase involved in cell wall biosynthesis
MAFLTAHSVVSGIQRVLVEVLPHLERNTACDFVCFDEARAVMVQLDRASVARLLHGLRDATLTSEQVRDEALVHWLGRGSRPPVEARPGDVVAVLGAAWMFPGLFTGIQRMKSQGAAVVVLVYDLIPVVFPGLPADAIARFRDYLTRVAALADRVPAISMATRTDFEVYCARRGWPLPAGGVTRLAADQWSADKLTAMGVRSEQAWPRPFALMVSTVEVRKNHILALRAWERLIQRHGADAVPDLVCVGRLGWNAFDFLERHRATGGLNGRVHLLTDSLPDARLAALYRDCDFTVFPSRYEGWGLPVAESLDMGRPVIAADNSSIREAGGGFARYFPDDDLDAFVAELERYVVQPSHRQADADRIAGQYRPPTWAEVAAVVGSELHLAAGQQHGLDRRLQLDLEYGVGPLVPYDGGSSGEEFLEFLDAVRRLPLTGQYLDEDRHQRSQLLTAWTRGEVDRLEIGFTRPSGDRLYLVACLPLRRSALKVAYRFQGGDGQARIGSHGVVRLDLGTGRVGDPVEVRLDTRPHPVLRRPSVRSFLVTQDVALAEHLAVSGPNAPIGMTDLAPMRRARRLSTRARGRIERVARSRLR